MSEGVPVMAFAGQVLCPIVVGRDGELAEIERALASAREGHGAVAILMGEAGIGKSRLTRAAEESARAAAMRVLRGRATSSGVPIPYRPLVEALRSALRAGSEPEDPALAPYRGVLRAFMPDPRGPGPEAHKLLMLEAVGRLLASTGRRDGALLVLEDLHWADTDTLALIDYIADNLAGDRVACLCTLRDEPSPALDLAEALAARRAALLLRLARLSQIGVEQMVRAALGIKTVPRDLLDALDQRAEGVPFVVEEMLTTYVASGGDASAQASLPHTFRELVRVRLARIDDRTRDVLFAAAVIGRTFDWTLLSDVSRLPREQVLAALHEAVRVQLVVAHPSDFEMPFGFRHALMREALIAELLPPELSDLSARAADAIEDRFRGLPGDWCERAAQLREAAGDQVAAARHLQEAAHRAMTRGALGYQHRPSSELIDEPPP